MLRIHPRGISFRVLRAGYKEVKGKLEMTLGNYPGCPVTYVYDLSQLLGQKVSKVLFFF